MAQFYKVQLTTTAVVTQTLMVAAESEEEAKSDAIAQSHDNVWEYQGADYDNIETEILSD